MSRRSTAAPDGRLSLAEVLTDATRLHDLPFVAILALRQLVHAERTRLDAVEEALVATLAQRAAAIEASPSRTEDALIDVHEAARRLGMSEDWVYDHADRLPFTRRIGRSLRFSVEGIRRYQARRPG